MGDREAFKLIGTELLRRLEERKKAPGYKPEDKPPAIQELTKIIEDKPELLKHMDEFNLIALFFIYDLYLKDKGEDEKGELQKGRKKASGRAQRPAAPSRRPIET